MNHNKIILIPSLQKEVVDYFKSSLLIKVNWKGNIVTERLIECLLVAQLGSLRLPVPCFKACSFSSFEFLSLIFLPFSSLHSLTQLSGVGKEEHHHLIANNR